MVLEDHIKIPYAGEWVRGFDYWTHLRLLHIAYAIRLGLLVNMLLHELVRGDLLKILQE